MRMTDWLNELRHAARALRRTPGFTLAAVATLGLAIGANAGIFSILDAVLLRPLPYPHQDRLVYLGGTAPGSDLPEEFGLSGEFLVHYRDESRLIESLAGFNSFTSTLRALDRTERIRMSAPTLGIFETLGVKPMLGRLPVEEDEDGVAVLSYDLWSNWFGSDPEVVGRSYFIGGRDRVVIGVMGPDFWFPSEDTQLWFPTALREEQIEPGRFGIPIVALVAPGVSHEALVEELGRLSRQLPERFGGSAGYARLIEQFRPIVRPFQESILGPVAAPLWVLLGAVGIVLLIACANVANLFMVRAERRRHDLAVRRALGAARSQLLRVQLAEAIVVALLSGALALLLATVTVPIFLRFAPEGVPRLGEVAVSGRTLLYTVAASVLAALFCGLLPAIRSTAPQLSLLRDGGRRTTRRRHWGRNALVMAQTAMALVLLIGSGLLMRSFDKLRGVDPGYDTEDIFTFQIAPEEEHLRDAPAFARFHLDFMERLAALPGVERVGLVENVPLNEGVQETRFDVEGRPAEEDSGPIVGFTWSAGDYFRTMGIELEAGRDFSREEQLEKRDVVLLSRAAANLLWPGEDPLGRRLQPHGEEDWLTVIGVVEDVMQRSFRDDPQPLVYYPLAGDRPVSSPAYVLKTSRAEEIAPEVRALVPEVSPSAPMYRVYTMEQLAADSMVQLSFTTLTLALVSALALFLGAVGLYAVLSFVVAERTAEIGVRMALGAQPWRVRRMVVGQGLAVVAGGVVLGIVIALAVTRALGSLLFGIEALDAPTFVATAAAMVLIGLLASYVPARRASAVDPIESLRAD